MATHRTRFMEVLFAWIGARRRSIGPKNVFGTSFPSRARKEADRFPSCQPLPHGRGPLVHPPSHTRRKGHWLVRRVRVWILLCIAILAASARAFATEGEPKPPRRDAGQQKELSKRLIRESATSSEEDVMDRLMRLMSESARRLEIEFDAGEETQAVQQRISKELDDAIKAAASRIHKRSPRDSSAAGELRRRSDDEAKRAQNREPGEQQSGTASSDASTEPAGVPATGSDSDAPFRESRRSWGNLPQRQREEVLQGIGEQFLERYRDWIERYYRALQESEE